MRAILILLAVAALAAWGAYAVRRRDPIAAWLLLALSLLAFGGLVWAMLGGG